MLRMLMAVIAAVALFGCSATRAVDARTPVDSACPLDPSGIRIYPASWTLQVGDTLRIVATFTTGCGAQPTRGNASWKSSDTSVATVDSTGLARARSRGSTTIVASDIANPDDKAAMLLQVTP